MERRFITKIIGMENVFIANILVIVDAIVLSYNGMYQIDKGIRMTVTENEKVDVETRKRG